MSVRLFYPIPFELMLTDDGTQTGNSNFVGQYFGSSIHAYFNAENFATSHFAVTGFKVQLSHGANMDGYGTIPGPGGLPGFRLAYEANSVPIEYPQYMRLGGYIDSNTRILYACGSLGFPAYYEEFADVRTYHCNFMRHGKPFIFPVLQGAKFGVNLNGYFDSEPSFVLHRFLVTGFYTSAPEYWSL